LLALVLAIGIVVDDAIVVVENVERVIEENPELPVKEACKRAMAEITGPILAITLVLLSVFVPVAFIPGISGQLFRQFAVAGTLAASAWLFGKTPQSFLPEEDQGAIFAALRLPEGASIPRTEAVVRQVEDIVRPIPGVQGILSVVGLNFIDYVASSNQAFFV